MPSWKRVSMNLPSEFLELCEARDLDPADVLKGFVADLCEIGAPRGIKASDRHVRENCVINGSDERRYARAYFDRTYF